MGYYRAGFDVVGIDRKPFKRYPFPMVVANALRPPFDLSRFDAIHASPPCQRYSVQTKAHRKEAHPDLVEATRAMLVASGKPYIIENVMGAPLEGAALLCGSMFGLLVQRHRLFETPFVMLAPPCEHGEFKGDYPCGRSNGTARAGERSRVVHVYGQGCSRGDRGLWQRAMGIDWMTMQEMSQAIPPAYTEYIGKRLLEIIA